MRNTIRTLACLVMAGLMAGCTGSGPASASTAPTSVPSTTPPTASPSPETSPSPTGSAAVSATASAGVIPEKPQNPTFDLIKETPSDTGATTLEYRITWTEPEGAAAWFVVYGVTRCLRESKENDGKPCVVRGMKIPSDSLVALSTVTGDKRTTTVSWEIGEVGPGPYAAILIRAANDAGDSIFTIVHSDDVCFECVY